MDKKKKKTKHISPDESERLHLKYQIHKGRNILIRALQHISHPNMDDIISVQTYNQSKYRCMKFG